MTEAERKNRISELFAELKDLLATPRSDWHAGFEALLRIEAHKYGGRVQIKTEHLLGEEPPRADFVVLIDEDGLLADKSIFRIFQKHNICEYKNPHDALNERVIRKGCGYANLYIGTAEHEEDVPSEQVTLSFFRAKKPAKLFREMIKKGQLTADAAKGIYHVEGIIDLPFQIVITSELEGPEYAAYRALTDQASGADVEQVIRDSGQETDSAMQDHYRVILELVARKNPDVIREIRRYTAMEIGWMEIFKDKIDEQKEEAQREARREARQDTTVEYIRNLMKNTQWSAERAMEVLDIPQNQRATYAGLVKQG